MTPVWLSLGDCERPKQSIARTAAVLHLAPSAHTCAISRRDAPEPCMKRWPSKQRAQGKPGARCTRSLACEVIKHTSVVTAGFTGIPGLPCAMVLTAYFVISPVTGFIATVACGPRKLDTSIGASGPHDFAVREKRCSSTRALVTYGKTAL
jgi:hypothetical protein